MRDVEMIGTRGPEISDRPMSRRNFGLMLGATAVGVSLTACAEPGEANAAAAAGASSGAADQEMAPTLNAEMQAAMTPDEVITSLREGNARFTSGRPAARDFAGQIRTTASGQYPKAVVLGCIDSRVPVEVVFDQGIGDIFAARVAGNVSNGDLLGSMEFACRLAGAKAVVVLGHTACGAVKGAISSAELGNLTGLVQKIEPAIGMVDGSRDVSNDTYVDAVAEANVHHVLDQIRADSPVLAEMESNGSIALVGAMYDVASGEVRFL